MLNSSYSKGFTLIELLLSLFLTMLMVIGIAQYLIVSNRVFLTIYQESLASQTLESLLLQASFSQSSKTEIQKILLSNTCSSTIEFDLTDWCQALEQLPQLTVTSTSESLSVEWQSPSGKRKIQRPPFN